MRGGDIAAQRAVKAALVERVVPGRIERGKYDVEIAWTPLGDGLRAAVISRADLAELSAA